MDDGYKRILTRPKSPTLHTTQRMKLKDDFTVDSVEPSVTVFKAIPFNPKLFEKSDKIIASGKEKTAFEEFSLSNTNNQLAKKSLSEYILNKENPANFKALALDRKIFE